MIYSTAFQKCQQKDLDEDEEDSEVEIFDYDDW